MFCSLRKGVGSSQTEKVNQSTVLTIMDHSDIKIVKNLYWKQTASVRTEDK